MLIFSKSLVRDISLPKVITVETSISDKGIPIFEIFGLITKSVEESKKRIMTSFENSNIVFPLKNIKVNLAPSEILKEGTHFDLAIAASILKYTSCFEYNETDLFLGELSFNGDLRRLDSCFYFLTIAKDLGFKRIFIPSQNLEESLLFKDIEVIGVKNILDMVNRNFQRVSNSEFDFCENLNPLYTSIIGNELGKKLISYSLSGNHHMLIEGFPGSGKSMLIKSAKDLAPDLNEKEAVEVNKIFSYSGLDRSIEAFYRPPFRAPHPTSSYSSIFGSSGKKIYPGEVALSNKGILFLDEFPEFNRQVIEGLRSPLEDRELTISRTNLKTKFQADFLLLATMNPCKCGYFNHPKISCKCTPNDVMKYKNKISGPILDRIDIYFKYDEQVKLNRVSDKINCSYPEFLKIKKLIQDVKYRINSLYIDNSSENSSEEKKKIFIHNFLSTKSISILNNVQENYSMSNRKIFKILNLSLTISFFKNNNSIMEEDILEAISLCHKY